MLKNKRPNQKLETDRVTLTVYTGRDFRSHRLAVGISADLTRELSEPVELSDEPFSILLASPGLFGGTGDAVTIRENKFKMREATAREIAGALTTALVAYFGRNDETNGYKKDDAAIRP